MSEFPKWIKPHESHDLREVAKLHEMHHDRVGGELTVLVHTAEEEAELLAKKD